MNTEYSGVCGMQFSIQRILWYSFVSMTPSNPIKLALRARCVNLVWTPEGAVRNWIGKGSGTLRARLATVSARLATFFF